MKTCFGEVYGLRPYSETQMTVLWPNAVIIFFLSFQMTRMIEMRSTWTLKIVFVSFEDDNDDDEWKQHRLWNLMLLNICRRFVFSFFVNFFTLFLFSLLRVFASFRFQTFNRQRHLENFKLLRFIRQLPDEELVRSDRRRWRQLAPEVRIRPRRPSWAGWA